MKIAIYTICRDEEKHVDQFMDSVKDADFITIADTGSLDNTVELLKTQAIMQGKSRQFAVHDISINPWRFDTARNVALALVPTDIDVCIRLDMDEVLDPGWREAIERTWVPDQTNQLWYWFNHAPNYSFHANYVHARHGFVWRGLDHEALYIATGRQAMPRFCEGLSITHHQDHSKPRTAILGRLEAQIAEDKRARTLYYLGREYFYYAKSQECIDTFREYLKQPDAIWNAERMDAMCMAAESFHRLGRNEFAIEWYFRALGEYCTREPFLGLARVMMALGRNDEAYHLIQTALPLGNKLTSIHVNPSAWDGTLERMAESLSPSLAAA